MKAERQTSVEQDSPYGPESLNNADEALARIREVMRTAAKDCELWELGGWRSISFIDFVNLANNPHLYRIRPQPSFQPVLLTLETQEEVDGLYVMLIHPRIREALGFPSGVDRHLHEFVSNGCLEPYAKLEKLTDK